jgi:hypothetical protein
MLSSYQNHLRNFWKKAVPLFFALCLVTGAALFTGCPMDGGGDDFGNELGKLVGTWSSGYDGYEITPTTLNYDDGMAPGSEWDGGDYTSDIEYVHKFSETAGVIIVKYTTAPASSTAGKYQGVYFKDLEADTVLLGNAYTVADYTQSPEVDSLEAAKDKFVSEANIELYGGGSALVGASQTRQ